MSTPLQGGLYLGLFDDAAIFPPGDAPVPDAVRQHVRHRGSWYGPLVGPFVCDVARVGAAADAAKALGPDQLDISVVATDGVAGIGHAAEAVSRSAQLRLQAIEVPLGPFDVQAARRFAGDLTDRGAPVFLEVPVAHVTDDLARDVRGAGLRLKLRTGGTTAGAFASEQQLAAAITCCVGAALPFKCTAGLHNAVRHRDQQTGFQHHGFLNVLLSVHAALGGADGRAVLAQSDPMVLSAAITALSSSERTAIRALFTSFGTCSVSDPIDDLLSMGLVSAP
ncbi:MAG: hypothetical protein ABI232_02210 [Jatrophihabitantaceae bacterium]